MTRPTNHNFNKERTELMRLFTWAIDGELLVKNPVLRDEDLEKILWELWQKRTQDEWVFLSPLTGKHYVHRFTLMKNICERAGVSHYTYHTIRAALFADCSGDGVLAPLTGAEHRIGREANIFEGKIEGYRYIVEALRLGVKAPSSIKNRLVKTIEFFPEEGKYHYDGHRNCKIVWSPAETKKHKGVCPVCRKRVVIGVMNRVDALADRPVGGQPSRVVPFINLIPLEEIIADAFNMGVGTKKVDGEYQELINKFGQEFKILTELPKEELLKAGKPEVVEAIIRVREGKVKIYPGYDGEYGKIQIYDDAERKSLTKQSALF